MKTTLAHWLLALLCVGTAFYSSENQTQKDAQVNLASKEAIGVRRKKGESHTTSLKAKRHPDWLINPAPYEADVAISADKKELTLSNGLLRRVIRIAPNAATVEYDDPGTRNTILRAVKPEAEITIDGRKWAIGGLVGQSCQNYLSSAMLAQMTSDPLAYQFTGWQELPVEKRFDWKRRPEWLSRNRAWPVPGRHIVLHFAAPSTSKHLPQVDVHYEIYNGIPTIAKWLRVTNSTGSRIRLNAFASELLATVETAPKIDAGWSRNHLLTGLIPRDQKVLDHPPHLRDLPEAPEDYLDRFMDLFVVTDYAMGGDMEPMKDSPAVHWKHDPGYKRTGIEYYGLYQPAMLECSPPIGPEIDVAPGEKWESFRTFEMLRDSTDRQRRGLAECRFWATFAPWSCENPIYMHVTFSEPAKIRAAIDQCADVGFEMMILSFGSGYDPESSDPKYLESIKELVQYASRKGVVLGGYSLLASRGGAPDQLCITRDSGKPSEDRIEGSHFGPSPCLCSDWGLNYFRQLREFQTETGVGVLEHDGSYPGDTCASTKHPGHRDFYDSQWRQWLQIRDFYRWCCSQGIYLNVPDWHFLNGSCKEPMGYVENNWSLPRADQQIITRQNIYDGSYMKGPTMGWMFVPLTEYHGGGAAATVEPLSEHLDHYETQLASLFGAGVQACYRGPRLYDTLATRAVVKKWVNFYKAHRAILDSDLIHLRRADGRDWDGWLHVAPQGKEKGLAMFYNPLAQNIERRIRLPLYYTGLTGQVTMRREGGPVESIKLSPDDSLDVTIKIPAHSRTWLTLSESEGSRKK